MTVFTKILNRDVKLRLEGVFPFWGINKKKGLELIFINEGRMIK